MQGNRRKCRYFGHTTHKKPCCKSPILCKVWMHWWGDFVLQTAPKENRKTTGNILFSVVLVCRKTKFYTFFKNAEGLGERRGQHICFANASHKWLSASLAVWGSPNGIRSRNSLLTRKSRSFKAFSWWNFGFILLSTRQRPPWNEPLTTPWERIWQKPVLSFVL